MKNLTEIIARIKNIRGLPFIIVAAAAGIILIIISSTGAAKNDIPVTTAESEQAGDYAEELENKVAQLLSGIKEAAGASVMVTLECGSENVYARDENGNGGNEYVIIDNGGDSAVRVKQLTPKVAGIAVVTKGINSETKLEITKLLAALLDLPTTKIYVW
jgi:stage III sporulation protein AG